MPYDVKAGYSSTIILSCNNVSEWSTTTDWLIEEKGAKVPLVIVRGSSSNHIKNSSLTIKTFQEIERSLLNNNQCNTSVESGLDLPLYLDAASLENLLMMMERKKLLKKLPLRRKIMYGYSLIEFFYNFIISNNVTAVIFDDSPHDVADYSLYLAAEKMGIKLIILSNIYYPITGLLYRQSLHEDYEFVNCSNEKREDVIQMFENRGVATNELSKPSYMSSYSENIRDYACNCFSMLKKEILEQPVRALYFGLRTTFHGFECYFRHMVSILKKRKWIKYYQNNLVANLESLSPFVFFPLHYQPERTTLPDGGIWHFQERVISALLNTIPESWTIVVKEHPSQLRDDINCVGRDKYFYEFLISSGRVAFLPIDYKTSDAIKAAQATIAITGTSGYESLFLKKPVICFGRPWYVNCPGVFSFNVETTKEEFNLFMEKQSLVNQHDVDINLIEKLNQMPPIVLSESSKIYLHNYNINNNTINLQRFLDTIFKNSF